MKSKSFNHLLLSICAVAFSLSSGAGYASTLNFTTNNYSLSGIGADIPNSQYDIFNINGLSGTIDTANLLSPIKIGTYEYIVGVNCTTCGLTPSDVTTGFNITIDGQTKDILFPWSWSSIKSGDSLVVGNAAPITFGLLNNELLTITGLEVGKLTGGVGDKLQGDVYANFSVSQVSQVPVPAAVWLFGSGLMGLLGFNRKRAQPLAA